MTNFDSYWVGNNMGIGQNTGNKQNFPLILNVFKKSFHSDLLEKALCGQMKP